MKSLIIDNIVDSVLLKYKEGQLFFSSLDFSFRNKNDLDEASGAYKDIDIVMANQKDLVEIVTELTPLAVIKG